MPLHFFPPLRRDDGKWAGKSSPKLGGGKNKSENDESDPLGRLRKGAVLQLAG
jgi:hypothetical protein